MHKKKLWQWKNSLTNVIENDTITVTNVNESVDDMADMEKE